MRQSGLELLNAQKYKNLAFTETKTELIELTSNQLEESFPYFVIKCGAAIFDLIA